MKFVRRLQSQMVPEWRDMYTDYIHLKQILNHISELVESPQYRNLHMKRIPNFRRLNSCYNLNMQHSGSLHHDQELILITLPLQTEEHGSYHTSFFGIGPYAELERSFFRALDTELTKVHNFYKKKEAELLSRANELDRQLEALYHAKLQLDSSNKCMDNGNFWDPGVDINMEIGKGKTVMELRKNNVVETTVDVLEHGELSTLHFRKHHCPDTANEESNAKRLKIKIPPTSPATTLLSIANDIANNSIRLLSIKNVQKAEEILRKAFVEFYHGLTLLRNYSSLNMNILTKILNKYDRTTGRRLSKHYLKGIDSSITHRPDRVVRLIDRTKWVFSEHFTNSNYDKAVKLLQPVQRKGRHSTTFFLGLFSGCSIAVLVVFILRIVLLRIYESSYASEYMEAVFPLYSMICAVLLHIYLYGANLYMWKKTGINHAFVFDFKRGKMFESRDVFLVATGLTTLALGGMVLHIDVDASMKSAFSESVPMVIVLICFLLLFLPFNVLNRSGRFTFLRCLLHCICAPLYKAVFVDMYLADQISSQVLALRHFEYFLCYYGGGHFRDRNSIACTRNQHFENVGFFLALLPFWWRCIQCARRWYDDQDSFWAYNSLKYFSTILAVACRLIYINNRNSILWLSLTVISSAVATTASIYWDIVADWGLLQRNSKNPWLRDKLALKYRSVYYISMVLDVILRFVWLQSLLQLDIPGIDSKGEDLVVALLEVFRRGLWNYFRVEYEHIINMEKSRAIKFAPLPFV